MLTVAPPVNIVEVPDEGLTGMLKRGEKAAFYMDDGFIVTGKVIGVNIDTVKVEKPELIFDTGKFAEATWGDVNSMCIPYTYLRIAKIVQFFPSTK